MKEIAIVNFFDSLKRSLNQLQESGFDNESMRHELIIRPIIVSPLILGWESKEVISQSECNVSEFVRKSYYWRNAEPKKKRPDMIIVPYGIKKTVAVIEEKNRQFTMQSLREKVGQLKEYQYLHNAVWGLLTDGSKWILQKNNEIYHEFESLSELEKNIYDLKECISKASLMDRLSKFGTSDLIICKPNNNIAMIISLSRLIPSSTLKEYLSANTIESLDFLTQVHYQWKNIFLKTKNMLDENTSSQLISLFADEVTDNTSILIGTKQLMSLYPKGDNATVDGLFKFSLDAWIDLFPRINNLTADIEAGLKWSTDEYEKFIMDSLVVLEKDHLASSRRS